jgi:hypothetical protein
VHDGGQSPERSSAAKYAMPHRDDFSILVTILIGLMILLAIIAMDGSDGSDES